MFLYIYDISYKRKVCYFIFDPISKIIAFWHLYPYFFVELHQFMAFCTQTIFLPFLPFLQSYLQFYILILVLYPSFQTFSVFTPLFVILCMFLPLFCHFRPQFCIFHQPLYPIHAISISPWSIFQHFIVFFGKLKCVVHFKKLSCQLWPRVHRSIFRLDL